MVFPRSPRCEAGSDDAPATDTDVADLMASVAGPTARSWGWASPGGGRVAHVDSGRIYQGTTVQACGLYPFTAGSGAPTVGVPMGRHLTWGVDVSFEPFAWMQRGLVTNPGVFVLGQPGVGKSTLVKRLFTGSLAFGQRGLVLGDTKGEYTDLVRRLDGQVIPIGPGVGRINPLDCGPLEALAVPGQMHCQEVRQEIRARRMSLLRALVLLARSTSSSSITEGEDLALGAALDALVAAGLQPTLPGVLRVLHEGPARVQQATYATSDPAYRAETRPLVQTLAMLCEGSLAGLFDGPTTAAVDPAAAAVSIDLSRIVSHGDQVVAAAMLSTWSYGLAAAAASRWEAEVTHQPRRPWVTVLDEIWRALRTTSGVVDHIDALTRLNRAWGTSTLMVTHSLDDLETLPTEADRAKARGFLERAGTTILCALPDRELTRIAQITALTDAERAMVSSWASPPAVSADDIPHPGRGKAMIKVGAQIGMPIQLTLVGPELALYDTDQASRPASAVSARSLRESSEVTTA